LRLQISVAVKDQSGSTFKPQQVMLLLVSQSTEAAAYVVGKAKRDGTHTLTISHAILEKQVGKLVSCSEPPFDHAATCSSSRADTSGGLPVTARVSTKQADPG
jgi:hypothetical protein